MLGGHCSFMKIMSSCLAFLFLCFCPLLCSARDTITINTPLKDNPGETLVSAKQIFELGFFTPEGSDSNKRYVGIWYSRSKETIVWVANRADPVPGRGGVFALEENKLVIHDSDNGTVHTITDLDPKSSVSSDLRLRLLDSGNLMLTMNRSILWQSFLSPTDTFLPGMNVENANFNLTSWTSNLDPSPGGFVFKLDQGQYSLIDKSNPYWKTTVSGQPRFEYDSPLVTYLKSENESGSNNSRIIMNSNGRLEFLTSSDSKSSWEIRWWEPKDACAVVDPCGSFASCSRNNILRCKCLPGFEPKSSESWEVDDYSEGCERKSRSICRNGLNTSDFLNLKKMKVGNEFEKHESKDEQECRDLCITKCSCQAYTYMELDDRAGKTMNRCRTWSSELNNIQEDDDGGHDLNLRVSSSDIAFSKRDCKPCSTNVIPYPLSTGPDCGMKTYSSFKCDNDTGQVNFDTPSGSYRVASIDLISHKFSIQVLNCTDTAQMNTYLQLNSSMPFQFLKCVHSSGKDLLFNGYQSIEAEVEWEPPLEPICSSPQDCGDWPESNCTRRGKEMMKRCFCNEPLHWDSIKVRCVAVIQNVNKVTKNRKQLYFVLLGTIIAATFLSCAAFYVYRLRRNNIANRREHMRRRHTNVEFHLRDSEKRARDFIDSGQFTKEHSKDIDVPFIDLESLLAATDNFSDANKLGRGGFGPVYKGTFPGGQEIAIKLLSSGSGQGLEEFKNEVTLIAKLQHRNLVRLVGYCFEVYERMLIYEYMPNKSLDCFIFDRTCCLLLNWNLRLNIIIGIARGLLYLHNDSRLRIIHRDLKTSNILLDEEMNPKISDFGLARIFGGKQSEATTEKVVGTYGYMSPEYALEGLFSVKSDVFSYGVVVLEILSGKKSVGFYSSTQALSLLSYVWKLWKEDDALSLMDQCLHETCNPNEFLRCLNVALLCVQEDPSDRPTILNVLQMIGSDSNLPSPKQPAFVMRRASLSTEASSSTNVPSNSEMTTSMVEGR